MDKSYWNSFYKDRRAVNFPSSFAEFCVNNYISKYSRIVEIGSGNGRDALYFIENQHQVVAVDQSTSVLEIEHKKISLSPVKDKLEIVQDDFVKMDYNSFGEVDIFYSRFTLHSIAMEEECKVLDKVFHALDKGGLFLIEVRTTLDPLYGEGEHMGGHTYKTDHSRRFIDSQEFLSFVFDIGYRLVYFVESAGLSVYKDEDPVLMRLVLKK